MINEIEKANIQGDEEIIDRLYSYLTKNFPKLEFKKKVPLKQLFPKPESRYLKSFWSNNSHADIAVFRHGKIVAIIELGGWYHAKDENQRERDKKKDKICRLNEVNCLRLYNDTIEKHLEKKITRKLFKKYIYGEMS